MGIKDGGSIVNTFNKLFLCFGAGKASLARSPAPVIAACFPKLIETLHRALLPAPARLQLELKVPRHAPLTMVWLSAGQTAGVAFWVRKYSIEGMTILLSGLDCEEDFQAIAMASRAATAPFPPAAYQAIIKTQTPLMATVCCGAEAFNDPAITTSAEALATSFFGILGVGVEENQKHAVE